MNERAANLASLLLDHPFSDHESLLHTLDRTVNAGDARSGALVVADQLLTAGVLPDQAVAVQLPAGPEALIAMMGTWLAGCVVVPVNPRHPPPEVARIAAVTRPAARLVPGGVERSPDGRVYEPGTGLVLWTSGTTGPPKAIVHTHAAYVELLDRMLGSLRAGRHDQTRAAPPNLVPVPLTLNAGLYNALFGLRAGAAIVLMDRFETAAFATLVRRFAIRSTVLPPAAITMLNDDDAIADLAPLRYVRSITAPLSPLQARRFTTKFGASVLNGYGQAEIGEVIGWTAADAAAFPRKLGAVGRPHPGVDIKIVGGAGPLDAGRLFVRAPNRAVAYAGGGDLDERVDSDGYLDTGDIARRDADGFVWLEGRAGDVINRGGNKVFPGEVEEVLRLAPEVTDVAVVGVPDDRLGDVPVAFLTGRPVAASTLDDLCRQHLVSYKVPIAFHHVDVLPRNDAGKVARAQLVATHVREETVR